MVTKPQEWKGSDLRSRTEVVRYLAERGGEVADKTGLVVGTMMRDLQRGRALSQLLADMEADGMLEREVRGRRTFRITLKDDWGLVPKVVPAPAPERDEGLLPEGTDLDQLAEALLAIVVHRATKPVERPQPDKQLVNRLRAAEAALERAQEQLDVALAEKAETLGEADRLREQVDILTHNQEVLQRELTKRPTKKAGGVSIADRLSADEKAMLQSLMTSLPETPTSKRREPRRVG